MGVEVEVEVEVEVVRHLRTTALRYTLLCEAYRRRARSIPLSH